MTEIYIKFLCAHYVLYGNAPGLPAGAWGPVFGDGELVIDADANQGNRSYAKVGTGLHPVFACPPGVNGRTFLTGQTGAHNTNTCLYMIYDSQSCSPSGVPPPP